jgi:hypothetical protein
MKTSGTSNPNGSIFLSQIGNRCVTSRVERVVSEVRILTVTKRAPCNRPLINQCRGPYPICKLGKFRKTNRSRCSSVTYALSDIIASLTTTPTPPPHNRCPDHPSVGPVISRNSSFILKSPETCNRVFLRKLSF